MNSVHEARERLPPGPWTYQTAEHDDWGTVRDANGYIVAKTCTGMEGSDFYASVKYGGEEWKAGPPKARAVAELLIEAERLSDPTPIDAEWLKAVGFVVSDFKCWNLEPWGPLGNRLSWIDPAWSDVWHGEVVYGGQRMPKPLKTRGDVRRLCRAMGITLREGEGK